MAAAPRAPFVLFSVAFALASALRPARAQAAQQLVPIIRQVTPSSTSISVWNTFVRMSDYHGASYVALSQAAVLFEGHLQWHPVSHEAALEVHGHSIRFRAGSSQALVDGKPYKLDHPVVRNDQGVWVPASFFAGKTFFELTDSRMEWPPKPPPAKPKPVVRPPPAAPALPVQKAVVPEPAPPATAPKPAEETVRKAKAIRRIVIDPGHGGKDPGTMSATGVEEKSINLLLAQELADVLREQEGYEVLMTRTDDTFIPLEDRAKLANRYNADLFISLHCNASLSPKLKGFEVYFLSEDSSDPHADAVARLENASLALEGKSAPSPRQVQAVLRSLVRTAYINESSTLGSLVDRQVADRLSEPHLGVKQAAFYVLRGAEMPAILIESGFLTNAEEAKLLQDEKFRAKLVDGLVEAIRSYDERKRQERR